MSLNPIDWFKEGLNYFLYNFVYVLFYYLEIGICMFIDWIQELMDIFSGTAQVSSSSDYLINIFFSNGAITGVYWGMAAIGVVLAFLFAIISVIRKTFDSYEKVKMSFGQIFTNLLKSILLMLGLNIGMSVIIMGTNVLMQQVVYVFDHADELSNGKDKIEFTDEHYAAMARIFNTIGNYSLNPSYKNRYNINSCYNDIRTDLNYLADQGVFDFYYETVDDKNNVIVTWQSLLQEVANADDYTKEIPVDVYNEGVSNALYDVMDALKNNSSIPVLQSYERIETHNSSKVKLGKVLFLIGTMGNGIDAAAKNDVYNEHPKLDDPVRAPFYREVKNVYKLGDVNKSFDIALHKTNYLIVYIAGAMMLFNMGIVIVNCVARIFNLLFLYVIAPPVFAVLPLDDGGKLKQWTTAFLVQAFSVFATVISMRIYLIFLPVILDPGLTLSQNVIVDMVGRVILIFAGLEAISKANGILTGILADNAGWQSISAGDMSNYFKGSLAGSMLARTTATVNRTPLKILGGAKLSHKITGSGDNSKYTGGVLGFAMRLPGAFTGHTVSGAKKGIKDDGKMINYMKGGSNGGQASGGGAAGGAGKGSSGGGAAGDAGRGPSGGASSEGREAAIPPQQRNMGG